MLIIVAFLVASSVGHRLNVRTDDLQELQQVGSKPPTEHAEATTTAKPTNEGSGEQEDYVPMTKKLVWPLAIIITFGASCLAIRVLLFARSTDPGIGRDERKSAILAFLEAPHFLILVLVPRSCKAILSENLLEAWPEVLMWSFFCVGDQRGFFYETGWNMIAALLSGLMFAYVPMALWPCGPNLHLDPKCSEHQLVSIGYNPWVLYLYFTGVAFCCATTPVHIGFKCVFMYAVGKLGILYMDPEKSPTYDERLIFFGPHGPIATLCQVVVICWLARFPYYYFPIHMLSADKTVSLCSLTQAKQDTKDLANNILKYMRFLFLQREAYPFELDFITRDVKGVGECIHGIEHKLHLGWYQAFSYDARLELSQLHFLVHFLKKTEKLLEITCALRNHTAESEDKAILAILPHVQDFFVHISQAVIDVCDLDSVAGEYDMGAALTKISDAERDLSKVHSGGELCLREFGEELILLFNLSQWAHEVEHVLSHMPTEPTPHSTFDASTYVRCFLDPAALKKGTRHTVGFFIVFLYCVYQRKYSPMCIISYNFILTDDTTLVPSFRAVAMSLCGIAMGSIASHIPEELLTHQQEVNNVRPDVISYCGFVSIIVVVSSFGTLFGGWSSFFFFWFGCFAEYDFVEPILKEASVVSDETITGEYKQLLDYGVAGLVICCLDTFYHSFVHSTSAQRASGAICHCLESCAVIIEHLRAGEVDAHALSHLEHEGHLAPVSAGHAILEASILVDCWPKALAEVLMTETMYMSKLFEILKYVQAAVDKDQLAKVINTCIPDEYSKYLQKYLKLAQTCLKERDASDSLSEQMLETNSCSVAFTEHETYIRQFLNEAHEKDTNRQAAICSAVLCALDLCKSGKIIESALRRHVGK
eukprot:TRINITY_DN11735_c0_g1_i1.p1 TRINITY_DN11735_c0_g1~~TRINITY_DN11735_c0_g1_i1.p1  ORF type:complete len:898 (-),score=50.97 TRINITY_DN11735_c0_g1_i1:47-2680(-)